LDGCVGRLAATQADAAQGKTGGQQAGAWTVKRKGWLRADGASSVHHSETNVQETGFEVQMFECDI
jgi:hypothetical protein